MVYTYKQIQFFDKDGIEFKDGRKISFDECRNNWAKSKGVDFADSFCVAERNASAEIPYFIFYTNEKIKIIYKGSIFPWNTRNKKRFLDMQIKLNRFGYSSYDCS